MANWNDEPEERGPEDRDDDEFWEILFDSVEDALRDPSARVRLRAAGVDPVGPFRRTGLSQPGHSDA